MTVGVHIPSLLRGDALRTCKEVRFRVREFPVRETAAAAHGRAWHDLLPLTIGACKDRDQVGQGRARPGRARAPQRPRWGHARGVAGVH